MRDLVAASLTKSVKELPQRGLVPARGRSDQTARVVVHDHDDVLMPALGGNLIDADPFENLERVKGLRGVLPDPVNDGTHGAPGNAHQHGHREL